MVRVVVAAFGLALAWGSASMAEEVRPSFDCAKATTFVEKEICRSPKLATLDRQLARLYRDLFPKDGEYGKIYKEMREEQRTWVAARNECQTLACLEQHYRERIEELSPP